jgi:hypothetical protein
MPGGGRRSGGLSVDTTRWPIVFLTYSGSATDQEWAGHLREIEEKVLDRREPFVQIIDQTRGQLPDPFKRAIIVGHQLKMESRYRQYCLGEAYVANEDMRRGMAPVFCQARLPYPYTFADSLEEAMVWVKARLRDA